jgi:N-dimethylarginine dimethylaminohydrolase
MRHALLIGPEHFSLSTQSATDNVYMNPARKIDPQRAHDQHQTLRTKLESLGVPTTVFPGKPGMDDAVFPNNAWATIPGRLIIGKMLHPVRQQETTREDIRSWFRDNQRYELVDLSANPGIAELTGSLVIDRMRGIGFCGLSGRADLEGARKMHEAFQLHGTFVFNLSSNEYHTNVVFTILAGRAAVLYPGGLASQDDVKGITDAYAGTAILISEKEKNAFVANSLAITKSDVLFSKTAFDAMTDGTRSAVEQAGFQIHQVDVSEFEKAGGSLRCLIAEIY